MAVENKYTDADFAAGKKASALKTGSGTRMVTLVGTVSVAAADDDGSVYRVFANVPSSYVPVSIAIHNAAITAGTDYDLGLYGVNEGGAIDADVLADGISMGSARAMDAANNAGMTNVPIGVVSDLAALSGQDKPDAAYDICLTGNTVGSAAGDIRVTATFAYL